MTAQPSRNQIRKAASLTRKWWENPTARGEDVKVDEAITDAFAVLFEYRASFQRPLDMVTIQLRRFVRREVADAAAVVVAQRLKRMPTIMGKLERQPSMDLTRMQDIGGCRAVLPTLGEVLAVLNRIEGSQWDVVKVYDYVENPKPSGYRAVHVVVARNDRLIEVQLRTKNQQEWGAMVERVGSRLGFSVKDSVGPPELLEFFQLAGLGLALEDAGQTVDDEFVQHLDTIGEQVRGLLERKG